MSFRRFSLNSYGVADVRLSVSPNREPTMLIAVETNRLAESTQTRRFTIPKELVP
jgi:hypothetical protein